MKDKNVKRKQQQRQIQFFPINKALIPALVRCIVGLWNRSCLSCYSTFSLLQPFSPQSTGIILEISEAPLRRDVLSLCRASHLQGQTSSGGGVHPCAGACGHPDSHSSSWTLPAEVLPMLPHPHPFLSWLPLTLPSYSDPSLPVVGPEVSAESPTST